MKIKFKWGFSITVVGKNVTLEMKLVLLNLELCNSKYNPKNEYGSSLYKTGQLVDANMMV